MVEGNKAVLISIVGPTAVGKTALSLQLAEAWGAEIISADSRQMYRHLDIGTAKPGGEELRRVPHHLVSWLDPTEELNAARFAETAESILYQGIQQKPVWIMVGGSTLYLEALWHGLNEMPPTPPAVREQLMTRLHDAGLLPLVAELEVVDPATFARIDRNNPARVIRALEVFHATGQPISQFQRGTGQLDRPWQHLKIGLEDDREALYERINKRVDMMMEAGLLSEVRTLLAEGVPPDSQAMHSIGYEELVKHVAGKISLEEAVEQIKLHSRRYAKRQLTWFRRYNDIEWFRAGQEKATLAWVEAQLAGKYRPNG